MDDAVRGGGGEVGGALMGFLAVGACVSPVLSAGMPEPAPMAWLLIRPRPKKEEEEGGCMPPVKAAQGREDVTKTRRGRARRKERLCTETVAGLAACGLGGGRGILMLACARYVCVCVCVCACLLVVVRPWDDETDRGFSSFDG